MNAPAQVPARIIIVDDAVSVRSMLRVLLSEEGYKVLGELASGAHLLDAVAQTQPDIVCLDYHLPGSNGIDLLRQLHEAHPAVAVVLITGSTEPDLESTAAEAGAAGFIRKPFSPEKIVYELRQVVHARRLLRATTLAGTPVTVRVARARAVIADDSTTLRQLLKAILQRAAIEVVGEAWDGRQAVELVAERRPDIVCLDIDMPVMDGLEALQAIRAQHPDVKVLMVTGSAQRSAIQQAAKLGARGYILKPFYPDKISAAIDKLLA
jgi:DNA-binding NarL/FixJ family response regulator